MEEEDGGLVMVVEVDVVVVEEAGEGEGVVRDL